MIRWPYRLRIKDGHILPVRFLTGLLRHWSIFCENIYIRIALLPKLGLYKGPERSEKVIISLTSYPARIKQAYYAIKSLMLQTYKADKIILWLSKNQFPDEKLPSNFNKLMSRGLQIYFVDEDLKSHKKYFYALQGQKKDELVVTYDDDLIYEPDSLAKLIRSHSVFKDCIICNRGMEIEIDKGKIAPYQKWKVISEEGVKKPSTRIMPSTGNGCLYPFGAAPKSMFDKKDLMEKAFTGDDIWVKYNTLKAGIKVVKTAASCGVLCPVYGSQVTNLSSVNCEEGYNNIIIKHLFTNFNIFLFD